MNTELRFLRKTIRRTNDDGTWYYSLQDIARATKNLKDPRQYVKKLKKKDDLGARWNELVTWTRIQTKGGRQYMSCADAKSLVSFVEYMGLRPRRKASFLRWLEKAEKED